MGAPPLYFEQESEVATIFVGVEICKFRPDEHFDFFERRK